MSWLSKKKYSRRKPLVLEVARQVGKTWLVKEFAWLQYKTIYNWTKPYRISMSNYRQDDKIEKFPLYAILLV